VAERQQAELSAEGPRPLRVGLLQTAPVFTAVADNLAGIAALRATIGPVDLAVTPELSVTGYGFVAADEDTLLEPDDPRLVALAAAGVGVGFAQRRDSGLPWNSYLLGASLQHKLYPVSYAPWNEHLLFQPGGELATTEVADARLATLICNDMWHPTVPWLAARAGAEVLVVPVASIAGADPAGIRRTWEVILQHTALLLQCYVVFVNRCGVDSGEPFWGGSRVVGPDGETLASLGAEPGAVAVELDLAALRRRRAQVPLLAEERIELVTDLLGRMERHV
jgi:predicted amidohydrolase